MDSRFKHLDNQSCSLINCPPPLYMCRGGEFCCNRRWTGNGCQYDFLPYDVLCLPMVWLGLILVIYEWVDLKMKEERLSVTKLSLICIFTFFLASTIGKVMGIISGSADIMNTVYYFFWHLASNAVVWTSLISVVCLSILDWFEIMSIMDFTITISYNPRKYKFLFIGIVTTSFILGGVDATGLWPIFHIFVLCYAVVTSLLLSIAFFITSWRYLSLVPPIGTSQAWLNTLRWIVLFLGQVFFLDAFAQLVFFLRKKYDFEYFGTIIAEVAMVMFNIICLFSMANRIKEERLLLLETSSLKNNYFCISQQQNDYRKVSLN